MAILRLTSVLLILNCLPNFFVQIVAADGCLPLKGLFAPTFTPFNSRGNLNLSAIPAYARLLKRNGIDGVEVAATAGEGPKLSVNEKKRLIGEWVRVGKSVGLKVMPQVGGIPLPDAMELARYSQSMGVDGILTLPELYYKPDSPREVVYFLKNIARAASKTPLLYYHNPQLTSVYVNMVETFDLASKEIPSFAGMKVAVFNDALKLRTRMSCKKVLFVTDSANFLPEVLLGFRGFILGEVNVLPQLLKEIIYNADKCNLERARDLSERLRTLSNLFYQELTYVVPPYKQAIYLLTGINLGQARAPELPLTRSQIDDLRKSLENAGLDVKA